MVGRRGTNNLKSSIKQAMDKGLGASMIQMYTSKFKKDDVCSICTIPYENNDKLAKLPCHENHIFHQGCLEEYIKVLKSSNKALDCPLCRRPFREEDIVIKILKDEP